MIPSLIQSYMEVREADKTRVNGFALGLKEPLDFGGVMLISNALSKFFVRADAS